MTQGSNNAKDDAVSINLYITFRVILSFNLDSWIESPRSKVAVMLPYSSAVRSSNKVSAIFMAYL